MIEHLLDAQASKENTRRLKAPNPRIRVYLENIGWTHLFGYDMNDYFSDPALNCELQLRQKLYAFENFDDDTPITPDLLARVGHYFDMTVAGLEVEHGADGVPVIQEDHPLRQTPDLGLMPRHNFFVSGEMPRVYTLYEGLSELTEGRLNVVFPTWERGPLDMAVQFRGYDRLMMDVAERPDFVHSLLGFLTEERMRWWDTYCSEFGVTDRAGGIADDWLNVPFISPGFFEEFVLPRYLELERYHGRLTRLHSCGNKVPLQHLIRRLQTLEDYEVNHWTDLRETCQNVPPTRFLTIALLNSDILLQDESEQEAQLVEVRELCRGRRYEVVGSALMRMHADMAEDIARTQRWIALAKRVLRGE